MRTARAIMTYVGKATKHCNVEKNDLVHVVSQTRDYSGRWSNVVSLRTQTKGIVPTAWLAFCDDTGTEENLKCTDSGLRTIPFVLTMSGQREIKVCKTGVISTDGIRDLLRVCAETFQDYNYDCRKDVEDMFEVYSINVQYHDGYEWKKFDPLQHRTPLQIEFLPLVLAKERLRDEEQRCREESLVSFNRKHSQILPQKYAEMQELVRNHPIEELEYNYTIPERFLYPMTDLQKRYTKLRNEIRQEEHKGEDW